jgi:uncharacterized protein (TIGR03435 family)
VAVFALASPVLGQEAAPRFEVATLKLSPPPAGVTININLGTFQNGRFTLNNVTLNDALIFAYDLPSKDQLVGLDWSDTVRLDVEALAPLETPSAQLRLMMRQLLAERLHVVVRREQRTVRYLALVVGKDGPKLKAAVEPATPTTQVRGRINHKRMPMSLLVSLLSRFEQQLIVDRPASTGSTRSSSNGLRIWLCLQQIPRRRPQTGRVFSRLSKSNWASGWRAGGVR